MKPEISSDARERILSLVREIERIQSKYGVEIAVQDDSIAFRDMRRTDKWLDGGSSYGEWDAQIFDANRVKRMRARNVEFEEFELWGS